MHNIAVLGLGNILYKDEGIGVYAALYLEKNYTFSPEIKIIEAATAGMGLMNYFSDFDKLFLLDSITSGEIPGTIYDLPSHELLALSTTHSSAHEVEVVQMLQLSTLMDELAEVRIIGIVPEDIVSVEIGLSSCLKKEFEHFIKAVLVTLDNAGIASKRTREVVSVEEIIAKYNRQC